MKTELKNDLPNVKRFDTSELFPAYLAAMEEAGSVVIPVSGTSMNPFLRHLSDTVTLEPVRGKKLKKGDTLSNIAARNNTSVEKLKSLNGIKGSNIYAGQKIKVK